MKVLVACEFSGIVREAFRKFGHNAWSCDLVSTQIPSKYHIQGDVLNVLNYDWDLMIAHPPCTRLANSGVRWLHEYDLWDEMRQSCDFFKILLNANIPHICIENPIPHKYAIEIIGRKYDQIVQPWMFGHGEQKATCLWLKELPKLKSTSVVEGREQRMWKMFPSPDRAQKRSITYAGIASAMAEQWG